MAKIQRARQLRRNATEAETRLWHSLRSRAVVGAKFRRQHPIGPFFADFACIAQRLVIELDGGQHAENPRDRRRTAWLQADGWRVLRFWNNEVLENPEGVHHAILQALATPSPSQRYRAGPLPLPQAGEEQTGSPSPALAGEGRARREAAGG